MYTIIIEVISTYTYNVHIMRPDGTVEQIDSYADSDGAAYHAAAAFRAAGVAYNIVRN